MEIDLQPTQTNQLMKKLLILPLIACSAFASPAAKAWDVNSWTDRASASTCYELVHTAAYYSAKYYSTGNSQFRKLSNDTISKAERQGCR